MKIYCIEQNFVSQKSTTSTQLISQPEIFIKSKESLVKDSENFVFPDFMTHQLFAQCELVIEISKDGENILYDDALEYFEKMTVGVNFTAIPAHDQLEDTNADWYELKAWPESSLIGPWINASDFADKNDINFCIYKSRELMQLGNSSQMIWDIAKVIESVSNKYAIQKGDLIFTGTPAGISEVFPHEILEIFIEDDSLLEFEVLT